MGWLRDCGVRTKLMLGFGVVGVILGVGGGLGVTSIWTLAASFKQVNERDIAGLYELSNIERAMARLRLNAMSRDLTKDPARLAKLKEAEPAMVKTIETGMKGYASTLATDEERAAFKVWEETYPAYMQARERSLLLTESGKVEEADAFRSSVAMPLGGKTLDTLAMLLKKREGVIAARQKAAEAQATWSSTLVGACVLGGLLLALGVAVGIARLITGASRRSSGRPRWPPPATSPPGSTWPPGTSWARWGRP